MSEDREAVPPLERIAKTSYAFAGESADANARVPQSQTARDAEAELTLRSKAISESIGLLDQIVGITHPSVSEASRARILAAAVSTFGPDLQLHYLRLLRAAGDGAS